MVDDLEESNKKSTAKETVHFPWKNWKTGGLKSSEIFELSKEDENVAFKTNKWIQLSENVDKGQPEPPGIEMWPEKFASVQ